MIKAIIFDFDGLILDTEISDYLSWKETYESFGAELPLDIWTANIGTVDKFNPYLYLEELLGRPIDREAVKTRRRRRDRELLAQQTILPGVESYLDEAQQLGLKIGIASSARRSWVKEHLARLGLDGRFHAIRCRDDVGNRSKPDAAVYEAILQVFGVTARQALALEDSPNGALAAIRAGLYCVVVPNQMTRQLSFADVNYRLDSLADMPLSQLMEVVVDGAKA